MSIVAELAYFLDPGPVVLQWHLSVIGVICSEYDQKIWYGEIST